MSSARFMNDAFAQGDSVPKLKEEKDLEDEDEDDDDDVDDGLEAEEDAYSAQMVERVFRITKFLQGVAGHPFVSFSTVQQALGIDLTMDEALVERLRQNETIRLDLTNEMIKFQPRVEVHDLASLMRELDRHPDGISYDEVKESGPPNIDDVMDQAICCGMVIALRNKNTSGASSHIYLYPRGPWFLVPLSGTFRMEQNKARLLGSVDVQAEVRRGDLLIVGSHGRDAVENVDIAEIERSCFRISLEPICGRKDDESYTSIMPKIQRIPMPYTRSSSVDPLVPKEGGYQRKFSDVKVPIAPTYRGPTVDNQTVYKHGCTNDIKSLWRKVTEQYRYRPQDAATVNKLLLQHNLTKEEWLNKGGYSQLREEKKGPKKRKRSNRAKVLTNAHLDGPNAGS